MEASINKRGQYSGSQSGVHRVTPGPHQGGCRPSMVLTLPSSGSLWDDSRPMTARGLEGAADLSVGCHRVTAGDGRLEIWGWEAGDPGVGGWRSGDDDCCHKSPCPVEKPSPPCSHPEDYQDTPTDCPHTRPEMSRLHCVLYVPITTGMDTACHRSSLPSSLHTM